jgi:hypothetical protein
VKTALLIQALLWALAGEEPPSCPTRDAVAQALAPVLIPSQQPPAPGDLPAGVHVVDGGDTFEVTAGQQTQRYNDPARDCAERARVAAVFIALALNPPMLVPPPPSPPVPPPPPVIVEPPPPPPPPPPARTILSAGAAARVDVGSGGGVNVTRGTTAGGEVMFRIERRWLGALATAGAMTSTESTLNYSTAAFRVREQRFPLSLSATVNWRASQGLQIVGDLGVALTPLTLDAQVSGATGATRLDVGPRAGLEARLTTRRLVAVAGAHLEYFPGSHTISLTEVGPIGSAPPLQIGFSLGVELPIYTHVN